MHRTHTNEQRQAVRQQQSRPILDALDALDKWMTRQRRQVPEGSATAKALDYSLRAGQRAAAVMGLIQSARMNGHDPHAYLKDVQTRLPTHRASRIDELLPHCWRLSDI